MENKYTAPQWKLDAFNCPHCHAYAHQIWYQTRKHTSGTSYLIEELTISTCNRCDKDSLWIGGSRIFPPTSDAPPPSDDMPEDVKEDFMEARNIVNRSPRAACALLRLAVQKLVIHLGEKGKDLNDDIANLVKKGLPEKIQKALDSVRVIGNNAVHPGRLDLKDDAPTAVTLFDLVNIIVDTMITKPKMIDEIYAKIPTEAKEAIKKRNGKE